MEAALPFVKIKKKLVVVIQLVLICALEISQIIVIDNKQ